MENLLSETKANFVYLMKNFDRLGRDIGELANDKKIGKSVNPPQREKQLNPTKHPLGIALYKCWRTDNWTHEHEKGLHAILDDANVDGEWYSDTEDTLTSRLTKYFKIWDCKEVELGTDEDPGVNRIRKEQKDKDQWREFFEAKKEEHPEWFTNPCETWIHKVGLFTRYHVLIHGNPNGTFKVSIGFKNKSKNGHMEDEDMMPVLKDLFPIFRDPIKKGVYAKVDKWEEAFELYKKVVTAGKNGDINLDNEITEEEE